MTDRVTSTLKIGWLFAATSFLVLPVVVPSYSGGHGAVDAISTSTLGMFLLSFPSSLVAMPMFYISTIALGFHNGSLMGQYLVTVLLGAAGYFQWFWIVPKLFVDGTDLQRLDLRGCVGNKRLFEPTPETYADWLDVAGTSPLEHVIREERTHSS